MAIPAKDTGYSWIVLFAATLIHTLMSSSYSTFGIYYVEFIEYFQVGKASLSWIGACQMFMTGVAGLFGGPLVRAYGCRLMSAAGAVFLLAGYLIAAFTSNHYVLTLTLGFLNGTGYGFYYLVGVVIVQQYFDKRRSTAAGITTAGLSAGTFIWPPVVERLIRLYSWRGALLIHCGIVMHGLVLGGLMRPFPEPRQQQPQKEYPLSSKDTNVTSDSGPHDQEHQSKFQKSSPEPNAGCLGTVRKWFSVLGVPLLREPGFRFFCIAGFFMQIGNLGAISFLTLRAVKIGSSKQQAALLTSIFAACSGVSRFVMGIIGDKLPRHRPLMCATATMLTATLTFVSVFLTQYWMLACYAALFGVMGSTYIALVASVTVDTVGVAEVARGIGVYHFVSILASVVLYPVSGALIDATGNAASPFVMFGITHIVAAIFYCIVQYTVARRRNHGDHEGGEHVQAKISVTRHDLDSNSLASSGSVIIAC